ncbi:MAG: hypothetical protein ACR2MW_10050 [Chthoniobacterales bacterium]
MFRKRDAAVKLAIGLSALLVGIAFGRWGAPPARPVTQAIAPKQNSAPNESRTTMAAARPVVRLSRTEKQSSSVHPNPKALAGILKDGKSSERLHALTDFIDHLAPGDFAAAMLAARKLPGGPDRDLATRLLVARWAELDPEAALVFAAKHKEFGQITSDIFQQLAGTDLASALTRAQGITDPELHYQALRGALGVMARSDPAGALRLAAAAGEVPHSEPLARMIYRQWSQTDPTAAAAAAAQDSSGAGGWRSPLGQVIRSWADHDPQAALNYSLTMVDSEAQARSVGDIIRRWSDQDATSAAGWINTMPAGNARDAAAAAFASSVSSTDVPTAVGWAQSISNTEARTAALQRVSRRVLYRDPTNGATTLQSAGVPAEILQNLPAPRHR